MKRDAAIRNAVLAASCLLAVVGFVVTAEAQEMGPKVVIPSEETGNPAANPETPNTTVPDKVVPPLQVPSQRVLSVERSGTTPNKTIDGRSDNEPSPTMPHLAPAWNGVDGKSDQ